MYEVACKKADSFINPADNPLVHTPTAIPRIFRPTAPVHPIRSPPCVI